MKQYRLKIKKALAIGIGTAVASLSLSLPSKAQNAGYYYCETGGSHPATVRQIGSTEFLFLSWQSNYGMKAGITPASRCQIVTSKLNQNQQNGTLNHFVPGIAGNDAQAPGLPVICASPVATGKITCPSARILWTLASANDYDRVMKQIDDIANEYSNDPLILPRVLTRVNGYNTINVNLLNQNLRRYNSGSQGIGTGNNTGNCVITRLGTCR